MRKTIFSVLPQQNRPKRPFVRHIAGEMSALRSLLLAEDIFGANVDGHENEVVEPGGYSVSADTDFA